eukprot:345830-Pyramimonas_sp.AAC.1
MVDGDARSRGAVGLKVRGAMRGRGYVSCAASGARWTPGRCSGRLAILKVRLSSPLGKVIAVQEHRCVGDRMVYSQ